MNPRAIKYRDGLIISVLAVIPLRRGTLAALQIGRHLTKVADHWQLDIPGEDTKTRRPLDYSIPKELSPRIDLYLDRFRSCIRVLINTPAFGRHITASQCDPTP